MGYYEEGADERYEAALCDKTERGDLMDWDVLEIGAYVQGHHSITIWEEDNKRGYTVFVHKGDGEPDERALTPFTVIHRSENVNAYLSRKGVALDGWIRCQPERSNA